MKAIMISIKPKWVAKILNGEKTIEIRKTCPEIFKNLKPYEGCSIDVYIYCTKGKEGVFKERHSGYTLLNQNKWIKSELSGKVVAKFTLNKVGRYVNGCNVTKKYPTFNDFEKILIPACIYTDELENYYEDLSFYAWHIDNLVIFDKPKELSEFKRVKWSKCGVKDKNGLYQCHKCPYGEELNYGGICHYQPLTKAPQSWCYVEVEE